MGDGCSRRSARVVPEPVLRVATMDVLGPANPETARPDEAGPGPTLSVGRCDRVLDRPVGDV